MLDELRRTIPPTRAHETAECVLRFVVPMFNYIRVECFLLFEFQVFSFTTLADGTRRIAVFLSTVVMH